MGLDRLRGFRPRSGGASSRTRGKCWWGRGHGKRVRFHWPHFLYCGSALRVEIEDGNLFFGSHLSGRFRPWPQSIAKNAVFEGAACERGDEDRFSPGRLHVVDILPEVGGKFGRQVCGAAGFAGLVIVAELDQNITRPERGVLS